MHKKNVQITWTHGKKNSSDAFYVRTQVFMIEQGFQNEFDDTDAISWHITLYDREEPVGAGRIFQDQKGFWQIGRLCLLEEYRGKKLGGFLLQAMEDKIRALGGERIQLSAQLQAQAFYEKCGYTATGPQYLDEHCPHILMEKRFSDL